MTLFSIPSLQVFHAPPTKMLLTGMWTARSSAYFAPLHSTRASLATAESCFGLEPQRVVVVYVLSLTT